MATPLGPVSRSDLSWVDQPSDREDFRETLIRRLDDDVYGVCHDPKTVIGGAFCDDDLAVSNACRRAPADTLDAYLCDDLVLQEAQKQAVDLAFKTMQLIVGGRLSK